MLTSLTRFARFVSFVSETFEALTGRPVGLRMFGPGPHPHIELAEQAELLCIAPATANTIGKIAGGTLLALAQGGALLLLAPVLGFAPSAAALAPALLVLALVALALTGLGLAIAWMLESTQGFHAIMNLFLIPMWFLSGSFFPAEGAPAWLRAAMAVNPLTYGVASLRRALDPAAAGLPSPALSVAVTLAFALGAALLATAVIARNPAGPDRAALRSRRKRS